LLGGLVDFMSSPLQVIWLAYPSVMAMVSSPITTATAQAFANIAFIKY
jgi:hypothetical protein